MANSKGIGGQYERDFSRELSAWAGFPDRDVFWRDSSSGTRSTVRQQVGKKVEAQGDIIAVIPELYFFTQRFSIDTKSYKEWNPNFINPSNKKSNELLREWIKVFSQCPDNMLPMMPCRIRDRKTEDVMVFGVNIKYNHLNRIEVNVHVPQECRNYRFAYTPTKEFFEMNTLQQFHDDNALTQK